MNDFTKEELKYLKLSLLGRQDDSEKIIVGKKIQSMIDNYCENEPKRIEIDWSKATIRRT